ncbi:MAG: tetratricopeptide repeat protein [Candidatus Marinimicrobia bacterium]|nr:tetratricopeptide repeat protein [Candidatus Neomarinimicrobiota bacterium]MCF7839735.1 tetratricopeptide repeat protein [Candidatus Neomarinimicrobiota bacterium]MCF7902547.1 tetratricopeptide repeat protein [Candidatus Neomarinimicrobiota bacterium]
MSMKCTECGTEIPENAKFCVSCGAPVGSATPAKQSHPKKQQWLYMVSALVVVAAAIIIYSVSSGPESTADPHAGMNMPGMGGQTTGDPNQGAMGGIMRELAALKERVAKDSTDAPAFMRLGDLYFQIGRFEQALGYYSGAARANSASAEAWTQVMHSAFQLGKFQVALDACDQMLGINSDDTEAMYNKGAILASMGNREEARKVWEALVNQYPNDPESQRASESLKQL